MNRIKIPKASAFLVALMLISLAWAQLAQADPKKGHPRESVEKSDINKDLSVDLDDLVLFGSRYLQNHWSVLDWCEFYDSTLLGLSFDSQSKKSKSGKDKPAVGKPTTYYKKHFKLMLTLINDEFACDEDPQPDPDMLGIENEPRYLLRMAEATDGSGDIYITDPMVGSLFIYDANLALKGEIKDLNRPLGVAVDSKGYILIGNDGRDNVEVYNPVDGNMITIFGEGMIIMPNSISIGPDGKIYVTDSRSHRVKVFDADYNFIRNIGSPGVGETELFFPVDTEVIPFVENGVQGQEVFVADQGNKRIQIYDTDGNHLGRIDPGRCGWFGGCQPPVFANLQSLDVDPLGRLHALDNFEAVVSILDPATGDYLGQYGEYGDGPGYLWVPMGLVISDTGLSYVTAGGGSRVEAYLPQ